jgi:hypothetical protein
MPNDGGFFLFTNSEKEEFIKHEPGSNKFLKQLLSAHEFINGEKRWCLWLTDIKPNELRELKEVSKRVESVKKLRQESTREATRKLAAFPQLFGEMRQPRSNYILIPRHSSGNRNYIPLGFFTPDYVVSDSCLSIGNANLFHFGVLHSQMHMAWVKTVCGRLESRFRYSNEIVYNNFPWLESPNDKQIEVIKLCSQKILDVRVEFPDSSLADLYDPLTMPPALAKAHQQLDKAVDLIYGSQPFTSEANRMSFLFELYEKYTANLFSPQKNQKKKRKI